MNKAIYGAVEQLTDEQLRDDKGAFFASVLGTLKLGLKAERYRLDEIIIKMAAEISPNRLGKVRISLLSLSLSEKSSNKGVLHCQSFALVLQHFFNHQTHHRGQITTLLSQMGLDVGSTDLIVSIPNLSH